MIARCSARSYWPVVLVVALAGGCFRSSDKDGDASTDPGIEPVDDAGDGACQPAPDFTLEDLNEKSPTYGDTRSVSDVLGKVLLIYFANYS